MKKAFIEQLFLGFLLLMGVVTFIATVNDERQHRNKLFDLQDLANESIKIMSIAYRRAISAGIASENLAMCAAQTAATSILSTDNLGAEVMSNSGFTYIWRDNGTYDGDGNFVNSTLDGRPDNVSTSISAYQQDNFWYKFLDQDNFTIPGFTKAADLTDFNFDTTVYFRDVINAGYYNMVGTYTLDGNGCATDPQLILDNKNDFTQGDILTEMSWPTRKVFFISDGYRRFGNFNTSTNQNSSISLSTQVEFEHDCVTNPGSTPVVKITTDTGQVERNTDSAPASVNNLYSYHNYPQRAFSYFEESNLNHDSNYQHMDQIAESDYGKFIAYMEPTSNYNTEAWTYYNSLTTSQKTAVGQSHIYEDWITYAQNNNIDYSTDADDNYVFVSEDLSTTSGDDPWGGSDKDFTDMSLNMQKIFIPAAIDVSLISSDSIITVTCP